MFDLKSTSALKAMREVFFFIFERKKRDIKKDEKQTLRIPFFEFKKILKRVCVLYFKTHFLAQTFVCLK